MVQNGILGLEKKLQIFRFLCTNMAALSFFQDGVSVFRAKKLAANFLWPRYKYGDMQIWQI
jgi:hypothetical protein